MPCRRFPSSIRASSIGPQLTPLASPSETKKDKTATRQKILTAGPNILECLEGYEGFVFLYTMARQGKYNVHTYYVIMKNSC